MDDAIMEDFQQTFPELDNVEALTKLNENEMKSPQGKERWRNFIMKVSYRPSALMSSS
jgi:hypothetical protein